MSDILIVSVGICKTVDWESLTHRLNDQPPNVGGSYTPKPFIAEV